MIEQITLKELCELMRLENLISRSDINLKQDKKEQIIERLIRNKMKNKSTSYTKHRLNINIPKTLKEFMLFKYCIIFAIYSFVLSSFASISSRPMLGYSLHRESLVWLQTEKAASVQVHYRKLNSDEDFSKSNIIQTKKQKAFVAKFVLTHLEPGTTYEYFISLDGKKVKSDTSYQLKTQALWQYRTDPPDFTVAMGSCVFINEKQYDRPGKSYGGDYQIFESIHSKSPDMMLWLGDNVYLREVDFHGEQSIYHRYTHTRKTPEMQKLLSSANHYAIWDDHDFGLNNSDRYYIHKDKTLKAFDLFWGNPTTGLPDVKGGNFTQFQYNDVDFFMMDNRYFRDGNNVKKKDKSYFGEKQIDWLITSLKNSKAPFKIIASGGQILNETKVFENYANYEEERKHLLKLIKKNKIEGVIF